MKRVKSVLDGTYSNDEAFFFNRTGTEKRMPDTMLHTRIANGESTRVFNVSKDYYGLSISDDKHTQLATRV